MPDGQGRETSDDGTVLSNRGHGCGHPGRLQSRQGRLLEGAGRLPSKNAVSQTDTVVGQYAPVVTIYTEVIHETARSSLEQQR